MDSERIRSLGATDAMSAAERDERQGRLRRYINLQFIVNGLPSIPLDNTAASADAEQLLGVYRERLRFVDDPRCPADRRIEAFLHDHFVGTAPAGALKLPERTFTLDRHGIARELSLPIDGKT